MNIKTYRSVLVLTVVFNLHNLQVSAYSRVMGEPITREGGKESFFAGLSAVHSAAHGLSSTASAVHAAALSVAIDQNATPASVKAAHEQATVAAEAAIAQFRAEQKIPNVMRQGAALKIPVMCNKVINYAEEAVQSAKEPKPHESYVKQAIAACDQTIKATKKALAVADNVANQTESEIRCCDLARAHYNTAVKCLKLADVASTPSAKLICCQASNAACGAAVAHLWVVGLKSK